jgi:hypothetical protein
VNEPRLTNSRNGAGLYSRGKASWRLAAVGCALAAGGCDDSRLPLVPVSGVVTFDGGPCPGQGQVTFQPAEVEPGLPRRPAAGKFDRDGRYEATSFEPGDGLTPGRYKVVITCYSGLPDPASSDPFGDINRVPADFQPEELVVAQGSDPIERNFDVPPKRNGLKTERRGR